MPQILTAQALVTDSLTSGAPITLQLAAGSFFVAQTLILNLANASKPVNVTLSGQGAANTILDCGGKQFAALHVFNASTTTIKDLTIQNCGESNPSEYCNPAW